VTIWLAARGQAATEPTTAESIALVVLAGMLQLAGTVYGFGGGRADPTLARSAVRGLILIAKATEQTESLAQSAYESDSDKDQLREAMGQISVALSFIKEDTLDAIYDWHEFHRDALRELGVEDGN
jgi:hypothetical protein